MLTAIELKYVVNNSEMFIKDVERDLKKLFIGLKYQSLKPITLFSAIVNIITSMK